MSCDHMTGDFIDGLWVCAHCFEPLRGRPKKYGPGPGHHGKQVPQTIVWEARIATDKNGTTLCQFVTWMVRYMRIKSLWTISREEARGQCLEVLRDQGEPFGNDGACWGKDDAKELVREGVLAYWDEGPSGANT